MLASPSLWDGGADPLGEGIASGTSELGSDAGPVTSAATPAPSVATPAPSDECAPVAVDFEQRARPKMRECYREAKAKEPDLKGTVRITVDIDTRGKIKSIKVVEQTLPQSVGQCMLKVVKATPLPEAPKCAGKSLTIPMTFPTPH
jgi:TonB family protein